MQPVYRILVVDDEAPMRKLLELYLKNNGYEVHEASRGEQALDRVKSNTFHLVILDIMMPGMDGWEVCQRIRTFSRVPIIMLTARDQTLDKVKGLKLGADDYLTKPFEEMELLARIEALLRRTEGPGGKNRVAEHHGITMDPQSHTAYVEGNPLDLTPKEFELLLIFLTHTGRVYTRDQLLEQIWGPDYIGDSRTVDSHVKNLREKLRKQGIPVDSVIKTVWGVGYKGV